MRIFIGSSKESLEKAEMVALYLESIGHSPEMWNRGKVFTPSKFIFECLEDVAEYVDAAVFIFNEDDMYWYRDTKVATVRDNVLLEYGLFCGVLGRRNVVIGVVGKPKIASDLEGLIYIPLDKEFQAERDIRNWIEGCQSRRRKNDNTKECIHCGDSQHSSVLIDVTRTFDNYTVSIRSIENKNYLGADKSQPNTPIFAHRPVSERWEQFEVKVTQDGWAAFKACNNDKYISVREDMPHRPLFASAKDIGEWECFKIFSYKGSFVLKARVSNMFIMPDIDRSITPRGNVGLYAYVYEPREWEQFQIETVG